jgi:capsular exopolysaccharide synthesis family protein
MSRIHEALKRAEQERAASNTAQQVEVRAEYTGASSAIETAAPPPKVSTPSILQSIPVPLSKAEAIPETLQFEEIWANCSKPSWKPNSNFLVFSDPNPFHPGTEQFRTLRSRLYRLRDSQPLRTILVSSAIPAEGKTLIAANLAHAMVRQKGCRVLLIDADLRSPRTHTLLGAPATPGLADYLQNGANEFEVIQRGHEEGFCFVPAGNHVTHPSELISSHHMKQFLERVKPAFDWIIIDSPPALPVADASVLGRLCDGVLFVVRAKSTPSETSQKACKELRDTHILGVVLNSADETAEYSSYYSGTPYGLPSAGNSKK